MKDEAERLEASNRVLQDRFSGVQNDAVKLTRERNSLAAEVADLKKRLENAERGEQSRQYSLKSDEDSNAKLRQIQEQLEEAREEVNRKVQDTAQFRQMRTLMQNQSSIIRDLRYILIW